MKKFSFLLIGVFIFLLTGCKKDSDNSGNEFGGNFVINGTSYAVTSASKITSANLTAYTFTNLNNSNFENRTVNFYFAGASAPAAGTYNFVTSSAGMGANEVYVSATTSNGTGSPTDYTSTGSGTVQVSITNGKIYLTMSATSLGMTGGGSGTISADIYQKQ